MEKTKQFFVKSSYMHYFFIVLFACAPTAYPFTIALLTLIAAMGLLQCLVKMKPALFPLLSLIIHKHHRVKRFGHTIFSIIQHNISLLALIFRAMYKQIKTPTSNRHILGSRGINS